MGMILFRQPSVKAGRFGAAVELGSFAYRDIGRCELRTVRCGGVALRVLDVYGHDRELRVRVGVTPRVEEKLAAVLAEHGVEVERETKA